MRFGLLSLLATAAVACDGCGNGGGAVDASPISDAYDPGTCGTDLHFTGEIVDWDTDNPVFCGIFDAHVAVRGGGPTANTAPNGRYDVCVASAAQVLADVTPSADNSECTTPPSTYPLPL